MSEKKSEKTSSRSEIELKYHALFEQSPDGILLIDTKGNLLDFNKSAHLQLGYTREEFAKLRIADLDPVDTQEDIEKSIREILKKGRWDHLVKHRTKNGEIRDVHVISQVITISGQKVFHTIWRDITEQKRIQKEMDLFSHLINKSSEAILVNDARTSRYIAANDSACASLGYTREELFKKGVIDIEKTFPDLSAWLEHVEEVKKKGYLLLEGINKRKDGTTFPVEVNVSYIVLESGEYMVAVVRDITERKEAEQKLRKSEERLAKAQELAHVGNWEWNVVKNELFWSDEVYRIYGRDPENFTPTFEEVRKAMHPDDLKLFMNAVEAALSEDRHFEMNYRLRRPDGTERTVHTIGSVSRDSKGKPLIKHGVVQDITEYKEIEEALRSSREFISSILNTVDEAFIVIDRNYRILLANNAYIRQSNVNADGIIGKHCYETSHKSSKPCYEGEEECPVRYSFEKGLPHTCLHRHPDGKGGNMYVEIKAYPMRDSSGNVDTVIEVANNITDKYLLQEQILRTQKLEAVGILAGGIAHDFNNLLQGIFGYISIAKMNLAQKEKALSMLEQAERALNTSVNLTTQLLTFSKGGKPLKRRLFLQQAIETSVKFALSGSRSDYRISFGEALWPVEADEGQISQVIQNIVLNASEAMPGGGTVGISVTNLELEKGSKLPEGGKFLRISISDAGIGIPEQYISKIFDPYFTTKQTGSGLGLATSYSIVRNHNGYIEVNSTPNIGSTFHIYLPAVEIEEERTDSIPAVSAGRKGRVLVMDDEDIVRKLLLTMMEVLGHEAECVEKGEDAIGKYREAKNSGKPYDLVILDLTVKGGMGGEETIKKILEIDPGAKAIVSSGYAETPVISDYRAYGFTAFLSKPYNVDELREKLNSVLG